VRAAASCNLSSFSVHPGRSFRPLCAPRESESAALRSRGRRSRLALPPPPPRARVLGSPRGLAAATSSTGRSGSPGSLCKGCAASARSLRPALVDSVRARGATCSSRGSSAHSSPSLSLATRPRTPSTHSNACSQARYVSLSSKTDPTAAAPPQLRALPRLGTTFSDRRARQHGSRLVDFEACGGLRSIVNEGRGREARSEEQEPAAARAPLQTSRPTTFRRAAPSGLDGRFVTALPREGEDEKEGCEERRSTRCRRLVGCRTTGRGQEGDT